MLDRVQADINDFGMQNSAVQRKSLHDEIATKLRLMIQEGELPPGRRVPEIKLCQHFGISRTPLREALKVLASEGLVELRPNRGSLVAPVNLEETAGVFETMGAMESLVGTLACERATRSEQEEVRARHARMMALHRLGDRPNYFKHNQAIHYKLAELTQNRVLVGIYANLQTKISRVLLLVDYHKTRWADSAHEHEEFMGYFLEGNGPKLAEALAAHNTACRDTVLEGLRYLPQPDYD